jgi:hypothetical protein
MGTAIGTPEYTDRYILFAGGWEGIFFCDQSSNPVDTRSNGLPGNLKNRAAFFFQTTLRTKVYPLDEY